MTADPAVHVELQEWVGEIADLTMPDEIVWVTDSGEWRDKLTELLVKQEVLTPLGGRFEGSFLARSHPDDVARVVSKTFIASFNDSGPLTNWWDPSDAIDELLDLLEGVMRGRTMYVVPFCMGPLGSKLSKIVVQVTDSPYVVLNTLIMARVGQGALDVLGTDGEFVRAIHSVGVPLEDGQEDMAWPCNPGILKVVHFPELNTVTSIGSGYGGNALLGKKCVALRLASASAAEDPGGALAEHMMLIRITETATDRHWHVAAAFPSACGKTNLAMLQPTIPGYKVTTIGDDIVWIRVGSDGRLYGINPEAGFFGVAPGTGEKTNPVATRAILKGSLLTNVAYNPDTGEAWWPGLGPEPDRLITWKGELWTKGDDPKDAAHANSRFTTPYASCETGDVDVWDDPQGVPLDLILFGGRRPDTVQLVRLARDWEEGVFFGAQISSETTAAAEGQVGVVTDDLFAMAPFLGLSVPDYIRNWLKIGKLVTSQYGAEKLPRIGFVNWFQRDRSDGHFLWPGFGENIRVLDWIIRALKGEVELEETPIGLLPQPQDINLEGINVSDKDMRTLTTVDRTAWLDELGRVGKFFGQFENFPPELLEQLAWTRLDLLNWQQPS